MPKGDENGQGVGHSDGENGVGIGQGTSRGGRRDMTTVGSSSTSGNLNGHQNGNCNRWNKGKTDSQFNLNLGVWTEATNDAVRLMSETERAIRTLSDAYKKHSSDIQEFYTTQKRLIELLQESATKDETIRIQENRIEALTRLNQKKEDELRERHEDIIKDKNALDEEKEGFETSKENAKKRAKAELAEQKLKGNQELAKQKSAQERQFVEKMEKLEQQKKKEEDENRKAESDLEASNTKFSRELEENKVALTKACTELSDMRRLRDSFESDTKALEVKLKTMENEFGLRSQGLDF